jgi:hypothetical protein
LGEWVVSDFTIAACAETDLNVEQKIEEKARWHDGFLHDRTPLDERVKLECRNVEGIASKMKSCRNGVE